MAAIATKVKKTVRKKRTAKAAPMTKAEMVQKMFADQQIIREAIQNGIDLKELEKTHGLKFATLPPVKD
jgi:hypothetical protein